MKKKETWELLIVDWDRREYAQGEAKHDQQHCHPEPPCPQCTDHAKEFADLGSGRHAPLDVTDEGLCVVLASVLARKPTRQIPRTL
jgi:hypothetical protein